MDYVGGRCRLGRSHFVCFIWIAFSCDQCLIVMCHALCHLTFEIRLLRDVGRHIVYVMLNLSSFSGRASCLELVDVTCVRLRFVMFVI